MRSAGCAGQGAMAMGKKCDEADLYPPLLSDWKYDGSDARHSGTFVNRWKLSKVRRVSLETLAVEFAVETPGTGLKPAGI